MFACDGVTTSPCWLAVLAASSAVLNPLKYINIETAKTDNITSLKGSKIQTSKLSTPDHKQQSPTNRCAFHGVCVSSTQHITVFQTSVSIGLIDIAMESPPLVS